MVRKKIINKNIKKSSTIFGLIVGIVLIIGFFAIMYTWLFTNTAQAGLSFNQTGNYNSSYNRLLQQQGALNETISDLQTNLDGITEATESYQVAWNGLLLLGTAILSLTDLVGITTGTYGAITEFASTAGVSSFVILLATGIVIAFVVLLVLANLKGEPKMVN